MAVRRCTALEPRHPFLISQRGGFGADWRAFRAAGVTPLVPWQVTSRGSLASDVPLVLRDELDDVAAKLFSQSERPWIYKSKYVPRFNQRVSTAWSSFSRLSVAERRINSWLSDLFAIWDAAVIPKLLGEAFGEVPDEARVARLRERAERRISRTAPVEASDLPQVFRRGGRRGSRTAPGRSVPGIWGAYVLSAGLAPSAAASLPPFRSSTGAYGEWSDGCSGGSFYEFQLAYLVALGRAVADLIAVWRADLREALQGWLMPAAYPYADQVPPLACSPCGVIRMASPEIPRGPQVALQLDATSPYWALAA
ncbi:hypothetical protein BX286_7158 [Streptomyces sp. 3211.6]|uniref:hypothetical protein n=1 Tax=Streptomyces sp. 3211.6 TaxID=1938845 RepID=UPI000F0EAA4D|nr:hypothetical protein [Streptomyces sp. 3211.6]RKS96969.1 hypothetical protein BX286_7158 [Streptomyces sp. 3211.6]